MLVRVSLAALCAAMLVVTPVAAKAKVKTAEAAVADQVIECTGPFGPNATEADMRTHFGAENVVSGTIYGAEGMELPGTIIYPNDPSRKMEVTWFDEDNRAYPGSIELSTSHIAPGGVRLGMSIDEVGKLNGEPFNVGGFWWDYGGYSWFESGALAMDDQPCNLIIRFLPGDNYPDTIDVSEISGEVELRSDLPLLDEVDTRVVMLAIGYPWPDALPMPEY